MSNDNKESKNNAPCEEKQDMRQLTEEELAQVNGGIDPTPDRHGRGQPGAEGYCGTGTRDI